MRTGKVVNQYKGAKHFDLVNDSTTFTFARNTGRTPSAADAPTFEITTTANAKQLRALALIQTSRS